MHFMGLRLRIFLFFTLIGFGGIAIMGLSLWVGAARESFTTAGILAGFGILALATMIWLMFDEHIAKPVEQLAARLRIRAEVGIGSQLDEGAGRYLGDLAPAALAIDDKLGRATAALEASVAERTAQLETHQAQLLRILSDIPIAVLVMSEDHQIVLYDGQAADLLEREAPARLHGSIFDYLDEAALRAALAHLSGQRGQIALTGRSGAPYAGHIRRFEAGQGYSLMLDPLDPEAERPLVYDFAPSQAPADAALEARALRDLTFVVFDCETTGLNPDTDEVVQLGAVRIVNGRLVEGESFDQLVNPGRPIPAASARVHGIEDTMVATAAPFSEVSAEFHQFTSDAVLIAHNALFDMRFLHRASQNGAPKFDNGVLDTVHLSAIVFGGSADHTLDAICERLEITIPEEVRHTGLGDARATAEAFLAMLPILEARGLETFGALRAEMAKHRRILELT